MTETTQEKVKQVTNFELVYDGGKHNDHIISADMLGNSLISFSSMVKEANRLLNGSDADIEVNVTAQKEGSFETLMAIMQCGGQLNVAEILGIGGAAMGTGSFFAVLQKLKGRRVARATIDERTQNLMIDDEIIESSEEVNKLLESNEIRQNVAEIFNKPVEGDISVKLYTESKTDVLLDVSEDTADYFKNQRVLRTIETVETEKKYVHIVSINFTSATSGWKMLLPNDDTPVSVKIADEFFWKTVQTSTARFSLDDLFYVELEIKTVDNGTSESQTYTIKKVISHSPADGKNKVI